MKKLVALCACLMILFTVGESAHLLLKRGARVKNAEITLEASPDFSERELSRAVKALKRRFLREDTGVLESVTYSAEENREKKAYLCETYGSARALILRADFVTEPNAGLAVRGLAPDTEYHSEWTLVRTAAGGWRVARWGRRPESAPASERNPAH